MSKGLLKRAQSNIVNGANNSATNFTIIINGHQFKYSPQTIQEFKLLKLDEIRQGADIHVVGQKLAVNSVSIQLPIFQKILRIFQGQSYSFERSWQAYHIMQVIRYFQIENLEKAMIHDMQTNFDEYDFFVMFAIANKFNYKKLMRKCLLELQNLQFQQMNIHKYDLLQLDLQNFQLTIKLHQELKKKKVIRGLALQTILQIIDQYCEQNSINFNKQKLIQIGDQQNIRGNARTIQKEKHDYKVNERLNKDQLGDYNIKNGGINTSQNYLEQNFWDKQEELGFKSSIQAESIKNKISITTKDSMTRSSRMQNSKKLSFQDLPISNNSNLTNSTGNIKNFKAPI